MRLSNEMTVTPKRRFQKHFHEWEHQHLNNVRVSIDFTHLILLKYTTLA